MSVAVHGQATELSHIDGIEVRAVTPPSAAMPLQLRPNNGRKLTTTEFATLGQPTAATLAALVSNQQPDLVLIDPLFWGAVCCAEALQVGWATVAHNPLLYRGRGLDIRGPGLPPPVGLLSSLRYRGLWWAMRARDDEFLPLINDLRRNCGLRGLRHTWDIDFLPPLIIANTVEPFEYPRSDWPDTLRFVGPLVWEPPIANLECLAELRRGVILVTGPSIDDGIDTSWIQLVWEVLTPELFDIVATFPAGSGNGPAPRGVHIEHFAPHSVFLQRAVVLVCHGGWGVTQKALAAGVPVLAVAQGYDRFEVGRRLELSEAGAMVRGHELTSVRLRAGLSRALASTEGAERVARSFASAGGAVAGADAIEGLLTS